MVLNIQNYIHLDYGVPRQCMRQVTSDVHLAKWASVDDIATYSIDVPDGEV